MESDPRYRKHLLIERKTGGGGFRREVKNERGLPE